MRLVALFFLIILCFSTLNLFANQHTGRVTIKIDLSQQPNSPTSIWIPYPISDDTQTISNLTFSGTYSKSHKVSESPEEPHYFHVQWQNEKVRRLTMTFQATRQEQVFKLKDSLSPMPAHLSPFLKSSKYLPQTDALQRLVKQIIQDKSSPLKKARAIYDWVVINTKRDPNVRGCGLGQVAITLARKSGKCADISTVFVALARIAKIPAREIFGIRLGKATLHNQIQDITNGYHCWAEFYLPDTGWVPVDPSDVRKIMLSQGLTIKQAATHVEYYFGNLDANRIALTKGRRGFFFKTIPNQTEINYFMYPYGEVGAKPIDPFLPKAFVYAVTYQPVTPH